MNKFALTTVAGIPSNGASAFVKPEVGKAREPEQEPWVVMEFNGPDLTQSVEMNPVKVEVVDCYHKDTGQIAFEYDKAVLSYDGLYEIKLEKKRHLGKMLKYAEMYGAGPEDIKSLAKFAGSENYSQASREADLAAVKAAFERGEEIEWLSLRGGWMTASKANNNKLGFVMEPKNYRIKERPTTAELIGQKQAKRAKAVDGAVGGYTGPLWIAKDGRAIPVSKMETSHLINAYNYVKRVPGLMHIQGLSADTWRKLFDEELDKRYSEKRREDWTADARL